MDWYLYFVVRMTFSLRYFATLSPAVVMSLVLVARTAAYCGSSYRYGTDQHTSGINTVPAVLPAYI